MGQACSGLTSTTLCMTVLIFKPRNLLSEYEHKGAEFMSKLVKKENSLNESTTHHVTEDIVVHKSISPLSFSRSSRAITKARGLSGFETTHIRISVNGRTRLNPRVPNEYFGNLVLWAFPQRKVKDLLREPLPYATKLIHDAIIKVNNNYFRSFIDFANHKVKKGEEDLIPTADMNKHILCPNLEVDSWLRFALRPGFWNGCLSIAFMRLLISQQKA
ncbi:hypothetical protein HAX54_027274 [Datura stramonium]|uniref:Uncharacterized protein n=1 Tax=Datura stramonium TaxID=4076 RepID=A0ABS8V599_DATST|nr:hypothetical protein [Datura stramonium]